MVRIVEVGGEDVAKLVLLDGREMEIALGKGKAPAVLMGRTLVLSVDDACSLSVALQALAEARLVAVSDARELHEGEVLNG